MKLLVSGLMLGVLSSACARVQDKALSAETTQAPRGPSAATPLGQSKASACREALGPSPFKKADSTHVLVADFVASRTGTREFGEEVARQLALELERFREEQPGKVPGAAPEDTVEFARLPCFLSSHEGAEEIARVWDADLVIWGKAYCNAPPEVQQAIDVQNKAFVGGVTVTGKGDVGDKKLYAVCPSVTLYGAHANSTRTHPINQSLASLGDHKLDLPALSSGAPSQLIYFALGLGFWQNNQPRIAAHFLEKSIGLVLSPKDENLATLHRYLGRALLDVPGGAQRGMALSQQALKEFSGTGTPTEAVLLSNIGSGLKEEGKASEAEVVYRRALAVYEKALGKAHPTTAKALTDVGSALVEQGKAAEGEGFFRRALAIYERALGKDRPETARALNNIGFALQGQGKVAEAETFLRRALAVYEKGNDQPGTAATMDNIGYVLLAQGKAAEAEGFFRRALAIYEKAFGKDHLDTARVLNSIGSALQGRGKAAEAEEFYRRALAIHEKALGEDHPDTATALNNLGYALLEQGKAAEAEGVFRRALAIYEKVLGKDHPSTAGALNNLGYALLGQGKAAEAEGVFRRVVGVYEKVLGKDHLSTATALSNLGSALQGQGKVAEAESFLRRALAVYEKALGKDHPFTRQIAGNLAVLRQAAASRAR